jgi:hypothetical protein
MCVNTINQYQIRKKRIVTQVIYEGAQNPDITGFIEVFTQVNESLILSVGGRL